MIPSIRLAAEWAVAAAGGGGLVRVNRRGECGSTVAATECEQMETTEDPRGKCFSVVARSNVLLAGLATALGL